MTERLAERINALDWNSMRQSMDELGYARIPPILDKDQCIEIMKTYEEDELFRNTIDMARYRFGVGLIFPTNYRPVLGTRGYYKTKLRHGVSEVTSGTRYTLGIIFHDAK